MTKSIVQPAKDGNKGIVVGDLSHIRDNVKHNDNANQKVHHWQFAEVTKQPFYKVKMLWVNITKVSKKDMPKTCALCGQETNGRVYGVCINVNYTASSSTQIRTGRWT